MQSFPSRKY